MRVISAEQKFCYSCMKEHEVQFVEIIEENTIKDEKVVYLKLAEYCYEYDELTQDEDLIRTNNISFTDAYKKKVGLLISQEIIDIRNKYGFSQSDLAKILGWGEKTITRYESYQVQDIAHNDLLINVDNNPKWVLDKIIESKEMLTEKAFEKYKSAALRLYNEKSNAYIVESIDSEYSLVSEDVAIYGSSGLNLKKVTAIINYIAGKVEFPYLTRTLKMLWYSDALSYKRHGKVITGLVYTAEPMGALPIGYKKIMGLDGIDCSIKSTGEVEGMLFSQVKDFNVNDLSKRERDCVDSIIERFAFMKTKELIEIMHKEAAYQNTKPGEIISAKWAKELSID